MPAVSMPAFVSMVTCGTCFCSPISQATQRVALPHASTSVLSALMICIKHIRPHPSALRYDELVKANTGFTVCQQANTRFIGITYSSLRLSTTTKSFPRPCIFTKGNRCHSFFRLCHSCGSRNLLSTLTDRRSQPTLG